MPRAWKAVPRVSPAVAAFECALVSAAAESAGARLCDWFGGALDRVESDMTLSALDPASVRAAAGEAWKQGFRTLKIKVSGEAAEDLARVRSAHEASGRRARVIIDGNQGLTAAGSLKLLEACAHARIPVDLDDP